MSTVFASITTPGPPGPPGRTALWLTGTVPPVTGQGLDGDMYLNSTTGDVYGPKSGVWGSVVANIKGSQGVPGATGPAGYSPRYIVAAGPPATVTGNDGDMYLNSSTYDLYGPKTAGAWGATVGNIKGAKGDTGATGPPGVAYTPRGAWAAATNYTQGDLVSDAAVAYIALQGPTPPNVGNVPLSSPTWWQPVAQGGSQTPWRTDIDAFGFRLLNVSAIGIGQSSPNAPLVVKGVSAATADSQAVGSILRLSTGTGTGLMNSLMFGVHDGDYSWIKAAQPGTAFRNLVLQVEGGNVGVGTTSPTHSLEIVSPSAVAMITGNGSAAVGAGQIGNVPFIQGYNGVAAGAAAPLILQPSGSNVGIGTTTPGASYFGVAAVTTAPVLDIKTVWAGNATLLRLINAPATAGSYFAGIEFDANDTATVNQAYNAGRIYGVFDAASYAQARLTLSTPTGAGTWADTMTLKNSYVGIATTSPTSKLTIGDGSLAMNGINLLQLNGWAGLCQRWDTGIAGRTNWGISREYANAGDMGFLRSSAANGTPDTTVFYLTSSGKVGIGAASAEEMLTVEGGTICIRSGGYLKFREAANSFDMRLQSGAAGRLDVISGGALGTPLVSFQSNGNVGIGTAVPGDLCELSRGVAAGTHNWALKLRNNVTGATDVRVGIHFQVNSVAPQRYGAGILASNDGITGGADIVFGPLVNDVFTEKLRLTATGNMGFAAAAPTTLLSLGTTLSPIKLAIYDGGAASCYGIGVQSGVLTFGAGINPASGTPQMGVTATGLVGIGTVAPGYRLDVAGDCNVTGVYRVNGVPISGGGSGFTNQNIVTGAVIGQPYQNNSGKTLMVTVSLALNNGDRIRAMVGPSNPPSLVAAELSVTGSVGGNRTMTWMVLTGYWYSVSTQSGAPQMSYWSEWY